MDRRAVNKRQQTQEYNPLVVCIIGLIMICVTCECVQILGVYKVMWVIAGFILLRFFFSESNEEKKVVEKAKEKDKEKEKKLQDEKFSANVNVFLEEAKAKYMKEVKKNGMPMGQYSPGPFETWPTTTGFITVPKWEYYEEKIKNGSTYRNDIIKKTSGDIVNIELLHFKSECFACIFGEDSWRSLKNYADMVEHRNAVDVQKAMEKELDERSKYNKF